MVGHEWFYWILSLFSPSQWVELNSTHWRSEFFAREERIQCNYSCATIRISHKQFLAKYFAVVESGLNAHSAYVDQSPLLITTANHKHVIRFVHIVCKIRCLAILFSTCPVNYESLFCSPLLYWTCIELIYRTCGRQYCVIRLFQLMLWAVYTVILLSCMLKALISVLFYHRVILYFCFAILKENRILTGHWDCIGSIPVTYRTIQLLGNTMLCSNQWALQVIFLTDAFRNMAILTLCNSLLLFMWTKYLFT